MINHRLQAQHALRVPMSDSAFNDARMLTYAEAAALLKVDKRTVRRRVAEGRYIAYGDGSGKRILFSSIVADIQRPRGGR